MTSLLNKHIIVGITGGIAAYKSAMLVRTLKKLGAKVQVIMTESAKAFITPMTLQALSGQMVRDALLDETAEAGMGHIELARWADLIVIAPASANVISELAHGSASHLLTTVCLASTAKIMLCPAMNKHMWLNLAVQQNIQKLQAYGFECVGPEVGEQACGDVGLGRMSEVDNIAYAIQQQFNFAGELKGKNVVITLGPTREYLDPVRYISNESSGKMGYALAISAIDAGAKVTVIAGPTQLTFSNALTVHHVVSASEMLDKVLESVEHADLFISTAAVSDYRALEQHAQKMKKQGQNKVELELTENPDIVAYVSKHRLCDFVVGFAAETQHLENYAKTKLETKGLDLIIANLVGVKGSGFNSDDNEVVMYGAQGQEVAFEKKTKNALAYDLMNVIAQQMKSKEEKINATSTS